VHRAGQVAPAGGGRVGGGVDVGGKLHALPVPDRPQGRDDMASSNRIPRYAPRLDRYSARPGWSAGLAATACLSRPIAARVGNTVGTSVTEVPGKPLWGITRLPRIAPVDAEMAGSH
jgi:hypothetical protein